MGCGMCLYLVSITSSVYSPWRRAVLGSKLGDTLEWPFFFLLSSVVLRAFLGTFLRPELSLWGMGKSLSFLLLRWSFPGHRAHQDLNCRMLRGPNLNVCVGGREWVTDLEKTNENTTSDLRRERSRVSFNHTRLPWPPRTLSGGGGWCTKPYYTLHNDMRRQRALSRPGGDL